MFHIALKRKYIIVNLMYSFSAYHIQARLCLLCIKNMVKYFCSTLFKTHCNVISCQIVSYQSRYFPSFSMESFVFVFVSPHAPPSPPDREQFCRTSTLCSAWHILDTHWQLKGRGWRRGWWRRGSRMKEVTLESSESKNMKNTEKKYKAEEL